MNLYVLVFLHIGSRRLWLSPATRRPDTAWVSEQAEGFLAHAQSATLPATIMLRDNDVKYPPEFDTVLKSAGLDVPRMPVRAPNLRAHAERVIQTHKHDALDRLVFVSEGHLNLIDRNLQDWYSGRTRPVTIPRRVAMIRPRRTTSPYPAGSSARLVSEDSSSPPPGEPLEGIDV